MANRQMPKGSVEIQKGIWLYTTEKVLSGKTYTLKYLYSSNGYCFYDGEEEIYEEESKLSQNDEVKTTQRTYHQYMSLGVNASQLTTTQISNRFISVVIDTSYEIS